MNYEDRVTKAAIEAALAGKCEVVFGSYTGDGTYPRDIILGFKPKAVLLMPRNGEIRTSNTTNGGLFGPNSDLRDANYTYATIAIKGFYLMHSGTNNNNTIYYYVAFK